MKEGKELLERRLRELRSSTDSTLSKTYELLVLMVKNAKTDLESELPGSWEIARLLDVNWNQISRLKRKINAVFKVPILVKAGCSLNNFSSLVKKTTFSSIRISRFPSISVFSGLQASRKFLAGQVTPFLKLS